MNGSVPGAAAIMRVRVCPPANVSTRSESRTRVTVSRSPASGCPVAGSSGTPATDVTWPSVPQLQAVPRARGRRHAQQHVGLHQPRRVDESLEHQRVGAEPGDERRAVDR